MDNRLNKGITEANRNNFCSPVQYARYKMEFAAERKNWNLYGYWSRVEDHLRDEDSQHDTIGDFEYMQYSDADTGL